MKAADLMIGDWVIAEEKVIQIIILGSKRAGVVYGSDTAYYYDELQPIPLTPEILEKNGFPRNKDEEDKHYCKDEDTYRLYDFDSKYPYFRLIEVILQDEHYFWVEDHCTIKIHYVHEFQHLLKLCKIGKEIIL